MGQTCCICWFKNRIKIYGSWVHVQTIFYLTQCKCTSDALFNRWRNKFKNSLKICNFWECIWLVDSKSLSPSGWWLVTPFKHHTHTQDLSTHPGQHNRPTNRSTTVFCRKMQQLIEQLVEHSMTAKSCILRKPLCLSNSWKILRNIAVPLCRFSIVLEKLWGFYASLIRRLSWLLFSLMSRYLKFLRQLMMWNEWNHN